MFSLFISIENHPFETSLWLVLLCHSCGCPDSCPLCTQECVQVTPARVWAHSGPFPHLGTSVCPSLALGPVYDLRN